LPKMSGITKGCIGGSCPGRTDEGAIISLFVQEVNQEQDKKANRAVKLPKISGVTKGL